MSPVFYITGASGFLGNKLCAYLATADKHIKVYGASRSPAKNCTWIQTNLLESCVVPSDVTHVIHAAALLNPLSKETYTQNLKMARILLSSLRSNIHFTCVSSLIVFPGTRAPSGVCLESCTPKPTANLDYYTQSKLEIEALLSKSRCTIVRPGLLVSEPESSISITDVLSSFITSLLEHPDYASRLNPNLVVDCSPVNWVARSIIHLSLQKATGIHHLAHPKGITSTALITALNPIPAETTIAPRGLIKERLELAVNPDPNSKYYPLHLFLTTGYKFDMRKSIKLGVTMPISETKILNHYVEHARNNHRKIPATPQGA